MFDLLRPHFNKNLFKFKWLCSQFLIFYKILSWKVFLFLFKIILEKLLKTQFATKPVILTSFNHKPHETRRCKRHRTLKTGSILPSDQFARARCAIRDISIAGARLKVPGTRWFPRTFDLYIDSANLTLGCQVAWRSDTEIGVNFAATSAPSQC
ncbi:MAG: PilZ domain-containing protein [Hyphomicrobiales bacterium]